jgi:hypothetical protein
MLRRTSSISKPYISPAGSPQTAGSRGDSVSCGQARRISTARSISQGVCDLRRTCGLWRVCDLHISFVHLTSILRLFLYSWVNNSSWAAGIAQGINIQQTSCYPQHIMPFQYTRLRGLPGICGPRASYVHLKAHILL